MARLIAILLGVGLLVVATSPASAYVWRCHTPSGDLWTNQAPQSGDCEEYDGIFNPSAAPPSEASPSPQPQAPPPVAQLRSLYRHPRPRRRCMSRLPIPIHMITMTPTLTGISSLRRSSSASSIVSDMESGFHAAITFRMATTLDTADTSEAMAGATAADIMANSSPSLRARRL